MKLKTVDLTEAEYDTRRKTHETAHSFAQFRRCPALYKLDRDGKLPAKDSEIFAFGRAFHVLSLFGLMPYKSAYAIGGPVNEKTGRPYGSETKAFAEWAATQGKPVLTLEQDKTLLEMNAATRKHPFASALLAPTETNHAEVAVEADLYGHRCQSRIDWVSELMDCIADLKTTSNIERFEWDCKDYGYAQQLAFYRDICAKAGWRPAKCYLVAVEKSMPYRVGVWEISSETLERASATNRCIGNNLSEAQETDTWPTLYEDVRTLSIE